ncbi:MAG: DUF1587 domain-containing protein, partial [Pseudomonadota bacterium]
MNFFFFKNRTFIYFFASLVFIIPFQNCSPIQSNSEAETDTSLSVEETPELRWLSAKMVIDSACLSCHRAGGQASFANFAMSTEQEFVDAGWITPGQPKESILVQRTQHSGAVDANMPLGNSNFPKEDYLKIYYWVSKMNESLPPQTPSPSPGPSATKNPVVNGFHIVNESTNQRIKDGVAGTVNIKQSEVPFPINIQAFVNDDVKSVAFTIIGQSTQTINDNQAPFNVFTSGINLTPGSYSITATPWSEENQTGLQGSPLIINLNVVDDSVAPAVDLEILSFNLINADTDEAYASGLNDSLSVDLSDIDFHVNFQVLAGADVQSMEITMSGPQNHASQENLQPWALFNQPTPTDYDGERLQGGTYIVTATAYSEKNLGGQKGLSTSFTLRVTDDLPPTPLSRFQAAQQVMGQFCLQCHAPGQSAARWPLDYSTESQFINSGMIVPGDVDQSKLVVQLLHYNGPSPSLRNMPKSSALRSAFTQEHYQTLHDWVALMPTTPPGGGGDGSIPGGNTPFACSDAADLSPTLSYSLTKKQYRNSIRRLFGDSFAVPLYSAMDLIPEEDHTLYNNERLTGISPSTIEIYQNVAAQIANSVKSDDNMMKQVFGCEDAQDAPPPTGLNSVFSLNAPSNQSIHNHQSNLLLNQGS